MQWQTWRYPGVPTCRPLLLQGARFCLEQWLQPIAEMCCFPVYQPSCCSLQCQISSASQSSMNVWFHWSKPPDSSNLSFHLSFPKCVKVYFKKLFLSHSCSSFLTNSQIHYVWLREEMGWRRRLRGRLTASHSPENRMYLQVTTWQAVGHFTGQYFQSCKSQSWSILRSKRPLQMHHMEFSHLPEASDPAGINAWSSLIQDAWPGSWSPVSYTACMPRIRSLTSQNGSSLLETISVKLTAPRPLTKDMNIRKVTS